MRQLRFDIGDDIDIEELRRGQMRGTVQRLRRHPERGHRLFWFEGADDATLTALYHSADGRLACRQQKPARDCNERSLLRRYGAGIKVLKVAAAQTCVAYRNETQASDVTLNMAIDGGVGGVVH